MPRSGVVGKAVGRKRDGAEVAPLREEYELEGEGGVTLRTPPASSFVQIT